MDLMEMDKRSQKLTMDLMHGGMMKGDNIEMEVLNILCKEMLNDTDGKIEDIDEVTGEMMKMYFFGKICKSKEIVKILE